MQEYTAAQLALRDTLEFHEHVERMFRPLKHGLAEVQSQDFLDNVLPNEIYVEDMPLDLRPRAYAAAFEVFKTYGALLLDTVEKSVIQYMEAPEMYDGQTISWGATCAEDLSTSLSCFTDMNFRIWMEHEFVTFCNTTLLTEFTEAEREHVSYYVEEYVSVCMAAISDFAGDAEDVYYDSADTEEGYGA